MHKLSEGFASTDAEALPEREFWTFIYNCCQQPGQQTDGPENRLGDVENTLETIIEAFDRSFDPADRYPEYLMVLFCKSMLEKIRAR